MATLERQCFQALFVRGKSALGAVEAVEVDYDGIAFAAFRRRFDLAEAMGERSS